MTQTIAIDDDGDILMTNGSMVMLTGADAVGQNCVTAIRAQLGEMQYAMTSGMPTFATAFNSYKPRAFQAAARGIIMGVTGVVAITAFAITVVDDVLTYTATIETMYGPTYING